MQITRLLVKNYRTYLDLDLDLRVKPEQSIILIGGANGGGKTTLFNAIHGALYGLNIPNPEVFRREVNAGALASGSDEKDMEIKLEIHFTGKVLDQTQQYILSRSWELIDDTVRFAVMLNLNGNIIRYGIATPSAERQNSEAQVAKIIKANLPRELSEYFLFDAMSAGQKLEESQLSRIIRENIENVMGFRKYLDLAKAARHVQEVKASERLKAKAEREEYLRLTEEKRTAAETLARMQEERRECRAEIHSLAELVEDLKKAQNQETLLKSRRDQLLTQKKDILDKEAQYKTTVQDFIKELAVTIGLPQLARNMRGEIGQIVQAFEGDGSDGSAPLSQEAVTVIVNRIVDFIKSHTPEVLLPEREDLVKAALGSIDPFAANPWAFLEKNELAALSDLIRLPRSNTFITMDIIRHELAVSIPSLAKIDQQIDDLTAQMAGKDYSTLKRYEEQAALETRLTNDILQLEADIKDKEKRIQRYDIQLQEEPDPKYEALCRLAAYFESAADELLKAKKKQLEDQMRDDLNINLAAYRGVISKVELSENLSTLSFRIFHKAGNELYLDQLNAASKQVVVQVLLKALHEYGDYDPPVMIDTVMGVLDKESRSIILEHYFPSLAHQTILLSTDSEIDPERDLGKIAAFVATAYTLDRDKEAQKTTVQPNYFGTSLEDFA